MMMTRKMMTLNMILRFNMVTTMEKVLNLHLSGLHEYESLYNQFLTYFQIAKQFQNIFDDYSNFIGVPLLWILVSDMNIIIQIINMIMTNIPNTRYDPTCPAAQLAAGGVSRPPSAASRLVSITS